MVPRIIVLAGGRGRRKSSRRAWSPATCLSAQVLMPASGPGGAVRLFTSDAAILEAREIRKDLPCTVTPVKPVLGFDLKFHAGYDVSVPLKELAGSDNLLTMVFRVTPEQKPDEAIYFSQRWNVPMIDADAGGNASPVRQLRRGRRQVPRRLADARPRRAGLLLQLGHRRRAALEGQADRARYRRQRRCSRPRPNHSSRNPPSRRAKRATDALNVKVMVNFAPQDSLSATLQPIDTQRPAFDSAQYRARAAHHPLFHRRLQHAGAARDLPAGIGGADRFSRARRSAALAQPGHRGPQTAVPEARRRRIPDQLHHPGDQGRQGTAGRRDHRRSEGDASRAACRRKPSRRWAT